MFAEFSLQNSRQHEIIKLCKDLDSKSTEQLIQQDVTYYAAYAIIRIKDVNSKLHPKLVEYSTESIDSAAWNVALDHTRYSVWLDFIYYIVDLLLPALQVLPPVGVVYVVHLGLPSAAGRGGGVASHSL